MTKELKAVDKISLVLKISKGLFEDIFVSEPAPIKPTLRKINNAIKSIPLIETALKRLERLDSLNCLIDNNKKLKALEIIKEKEVNIHCLIDCFLTNVDFYNQVITDKSRQLTQEEFDLLKEVLL